LSAPGAAIHGDMTDVFRAAVHGRDVRRRLLRQNIFWSRLKALRERAAGFEANRADSTALQHISRFVAISAAAMMIPDHDKEAVTWTMP
jgi:hypothetical protein